MTNQNGVSQDAIAISQLLGQFARFGIRMGLEPTHILLNQLGNPHQQVPVVHVAGTNGKGSVCAYLSSILAQAGYRVGRYTSPHLVDWTERICIDGEAIAPSQLRAILQHIDQVIGDRHLDVTQFEVITAAAWLYFAQQSVDVAIIEVGLGGRLDSTNVCDRPLASIITSISRDHWQQLGPTLGHIAMEKAGILKPAVPAVLGPVPPAAETVICQRLEALQCPAYWVVPATPIGPDRLQYHPPTPSPTEPEQVPAASTPNSNPSFTYSLSLLGDHQRVNSSLAIATIHLLQQHGWAITSDHIRAGLAQTQWAGRLQWMQWRGTKILVDGAHNEASAATLRRYVDQLPQPTHWIMGILKTKDHEAIFTALLRQGDRLSLVPVPEHASANPQDLAAIAHRCCPNLHQCQPHPDIVQTLDQVAASSPPAHSEGGHQGTIVLCGSLYLIGYVLRQARISPVATPQR